MKPIVYHGSIEAAHGPALLIGPDETHRRGRFHITTKQGDLFNVRPSSFTMLTLAG